VRGRGNGWIQPRTKSPAARAGGAATRQNSHLHGRSLPGAGGLPCVATNQVRKNMGTGANEHGIILASWNELLVLGWNALELIVDPFAQKKRGLIEVTSFEMADAAASSSGGAASLAAPLRAETFLGEPVGLRGTPRSTPRTRLGNCAQVASSEDFSVRAWPERGAGSSPAVIRSVREHSLMKEVCPVPVHTRFDAERAAGILNAIRAGKPIPAPPGGHWNDVDALVVAGCLAFAVRGTAIAALTKEKPTHRERAEMLALMAQGAVNSAIFWYARHPVLGDEDAQRRVPARMPTPVRHPGGPSATITLPRAGTCQQLVNLHRVRQPGNLGRTARASSGVGSP